MTSASSSRPADLRDGAQELAVGPDLTGLLWTDVRTRLTGPARICLRATFPAAATRAFSATTEDFWGEWLSDDRLNRLSGLVIVVDADGAPIAWVAGEDRRFGGRTCFYANSAGVDPDYQGTGISSTIWRFLLRAAIVRSAPRSLYAVMRTGNPLVYGAWSSATGRADTTWPTPGGDVPEHVRRIATDVATDLGQADRLDPRTMVISDAYDATENGLWESRPTSDRTDIDGWFADILGPRDAVVLVVAFPPLRTMINELRRSARRLRRKASGARRG